MVEEVSSGEFSTMNLAFGCGFNFGKEKVKQRDGTAEWLKNDSTRVTELIATFRHILS